jgi:hypothetical protein
MCGRTTCKHKFRRFITTRTWGKPPPSSLYYSLRLATWPAPKCHFVLGVPKFSELGLLWLWRPIISFVDFLLKWGLKQSCNLCRNFSKDMWHATWMQINQGDSWLLAVGSQIGSLTFDHSIGHNLYFKYPNGSCEPILDIV